MPTRRFAALLIVSFLTLGTTGCASATYKGVYVVSNDAPEAYIGMRLKWAIDRKSEYHHPYESSVASVSQTE